MPSISTKSKSVRGNSHNIDQGGNVSHDENNKSITSSSDSSRTTSSDEEDSKYFRALEETIRQKYASLGPTAIQLPACQYLTCNFVTAVFAASFCSAFQHGYHQGVTNNQIWTMTKWIKNVSNHSPEVEEQSVKWQWTFFVSLFNLGGLLGSIILFFITRHHSKKNGLKLNNMSTIIGAILLGFSKNLNSYGFLLTGRVVVGLNAGLNAGLAIMYLVEISPISLRGTIASTYPVSMAFAIWTSQILGHESVLGSEEFWEWLFLIPIIPAILQIIIIAKCPESPKLIVIEWNNLHRARKALRWFRNSDDVEDELERIIYEKIQNDTGAVKCSEMLFNPALRKPLRISIMMMLAQQLTGMSAATYFSNRIFIKAGMEKIPSENATVILGGVYTAMTIVALFIVERFGRKTLMYIGISGMLFSTIGMVICLKLVKREENPGGNTTISNAIVILLSCFMSFYAIGPGPIPWFYVDELFAHRTRPYANAIADGVNWTANFIVSIAFPTLLTEENVAENVFFVFIVTQIFFLWYIYYDVPETKGKTIGEVQQDMRVSLTVKAKKSDDEQVKRKEAPRTSEE